MSSADMIVEKGADGLEGLAHKAAARGGVAEKLADELADDAAFLRKLKPSLVRARLKGEAPTNEPPGSGTVVTPRPAKPPKPKGAGPNPFVVLGVAFAVGIALAKVIDWRGHAHPRD